MDKLNCISYIYLVIALLVVGSTPVTAQSQWGYQQGGAYAGMGVRSGAYGRYPGLSPLGIGGYRDRMYRGGGPYVGTGLISIDPYGGAINPYVGRGIAGVLRPVIGGVGSMLPPIGGGLIPPIVPDVVSDQSSQSSSTINISNTNRNVHDQSGSGGVIVSQGRTSGTSGCGQPCYPGGGCPPGLYCQYMQSCGPICRGGMMGK